MDIIEVYNQYLEQANIETGIQRKKEAKKRYSASGAGMCLRKHYYGVNNYERLIPESKSLRNMRLGTVFGADVEKAMKWYRLFQQSMGYDVRIATEGFVEHPSLPLCGHFDILVVDENKKGQLVDIKTAHGFKFSQLFGRKKDPNPSTNYQMQLGTYAWMLNETKEYCEEVTSMQLVYYNKNDAMMKSLDVPLDFIGIAQDYWEMLFESDGNLPALGNMAPAYGWECGKYCDFRQHCDSPLLKDKDKPTVKTKEVLIA